MTDVILMVLVLVVALVGAMPEPEKGESSHGSVRDRVFPVRVRTGVSAG